MEHRSEVETQFVVSQVKGAAFLDGDVGFGSRTVVTLDHAHRFGVPYQADAGVVLADEADGSGVIRLHVVDDEIVDGAVANDGADFVKVFGEKSHVDGVNQCHGFLVGYDV